MPTPGPSHVLLPLPKTLSCKSCNEVVHDELLTKCTDRKEQALEADVALTKHKRKDEPMQKDMWRGLGSELKVSRTHSKEKGSKHRQR